MNHYIDNAKHTNAVFGQSTVFINVIALQQTGGRATRFSAATPLSPPKVTKRQKMCWAGTNSRWPPIAFSTQTFSGDMSPPKVFLQTTTLTKIVTISNPPFSGDCPRRKCYIIFDQNSCTFYCRGYYSRHYFWRGHVPAKSLGAKFPSKLQLFPKNFLIYIITYT